MMTVDERGHPVGEIELIPVSSPGSPVEPSDRFIELDVLRGVAVLGILLLNIRSFSMPVAAYSNPTVWGISNRLDAIAFVVVELVASQKFLAIFSFLFGVGIEMMFERLESRRAAAGEIHVRRMTIILVIGLLHAYLVWFGDILVGYALCGLLLFPLRALRSRFLLLAGLLMLLVPVAITFGYQATLHQWPEDALEMTRAEWQPAPEEIEREIAIYRGNWSGQLAHRASLAWSLQTYGFLTAGFWHSGGLMLIGFAAWRSRWFARVSVRSLVVLVAAGALAGLVITALGLTLNAEDGWAMETALFGGSVPGYVGSLPMAAAWVSAILLAMRTRLRRGFERLAPLGRMALTAYLLQSLAGTMLFYGQGLGLFARLGRAEQIAVVVAIWIGLTIFATLWLRRFRFGPVEALWRWLTYGSLSSAGDQRNQKKENEDQ